ncbi:hypothetical protein GCM10028784_24350 [Myceligenerans cantabricum]
MRVEAAGPMTAPSSTALPSATHPVSTGAADGVPVLYAPWRENQVTGGLVFRVGQADETLATRGLTHLVEHLALFDQNLTDTHHNGVTNDTTTMFHATGTLEEVVAYLNGVCAALRDLPSHRIETEKEILRTEEAGHRGAVAGRMRIERYGASTYGLSGYRELGLDRLSTDDVRRWAHSRFNRDNAVVFLTVGDLPAGLDLRLPAGQRHPVPAPSSALPDGTPAYFRGAEGGVMLDAVVPRTTAARLFVHVAGRALFRELRQEGGYSYRPDADYTVRDARSAVVTLSADALPDKQSAVVGGMVDTLARLRLGSIDPAELENAKEQARKQCDGPDVGARTLPGAAVDLLLGRPSLRPDQYLAEIEAVTADDVRRVARQVWEDALLQVPGRDADWAGMVSVPQWSTAPVGGTTYHASDSEARLRLGSDGVSLVTPYGAVTVRFAETAVMIAYADGGRGLIGLDGFRVAVEPTHFRGLTPENVARQVDSRVPPHLVVRATRDPDEVPRPQPVRRRRPGIGARIGRAVLPVVGWPLVALMLYVTVAVLFTVMGETTGQVVPAPPLGLLAVVLAGVMVWRNLRRRRRRTR